MADLLILFAEVLAQGEEGPRERIPPTAAEQILLQKAPARNLVLYKRADKIRPPKKKPTKKKAASKKGGRDRAYKD